MLLPVLLRKRRSDTHKGDYGHVFVLGASPGLTGAVCLCAESALKIGAGLVTVGVPKSLNMVFEIKLTEVMSLPLKDTEDNALSLEAFAKIREFTHKIDVMALGCGASHARSTQKLILKIIKDIDRPIVVDADGINALINNLRFLEERKTQHLVLTPHLGEFSRLIKKNIDHIKKKRKELAKEFALRYNSVLVLKGYHTLITDGKKLFENKTGNPGMATAGSGDILTGIISGLVAQGLKVFKAAQLGVYLHGLAADLAAVKKTQACLVASDIIEYLPRAIKKLLHG